jgi:hypothetical protein
MSLICKSTITWCDGRYLPSIENLFRDYLKLGTDFPWNFASGTSARLPLCEAIAFEHPVPKPAISTSFTILRSTQPV